MINAIEVLEKMRMLPVADLEMLTGGGPLLVLAPHPDDESLGCGGIIAEARARGYPVYVIVVTDGIGSHPASRSHFPARLQAVREDEAAAAVAELGVSASCLNFLRLRDGKVPHRGQEFRKAASYLADFIRSHGIVTIFATWVHDPHPDHFATYRLGCAAATAVGISLLCYPVWGWTLSARTWLPVAQLKGFRVDIRKTLSAKLRAVACHRSQTTNLIADDPEGFKLSAEFRSIFEQPFETFLQS